MLNFGGDEIAGAFGGVDIKGDFGGLDAERLGGEGRFTCGVEGGTEGGVGIDAEIGAEGVVVILLPRSLSPSFSNIILILFPFFADAS